MQHDQTDRFDRVLEFSRHREGARWTDIVHSQGSRPESATSSPAESRRINGGWSIERDNLINNFHSRNITTSPCRLFLSHGRIY